MSDDVAPRAPAVERTVRPSSLSEWPDCSRRWAARHLRQEVEAAGYDLRPRPPSHAGALVGTGVHAGAAYTLANVRVSGSLPLFAEAHEAAIEGFRERMEVEGATWDDITDRPNTAEAQVKRMTSAFYLEVAPEIRPLLVEERVEAEVAPGWVISGQADNLGGLAADAQADLLDANRLVLRDLKTGRVPRHHGPQLGAYDLLLSAHGHQPARAQIDFIRRVAIRQEQPAAEVHEVDLTVARQDAWSILRAVMRDVAEFERRLGDPNGEDPRGAFLANPSSSLCSDRWCPAWGTRFCASHRR